MITWRGGNKAPPSPTARCEQQRTALQYPVAPRTHIHGRSVSGLSWAPNPRVPSPLCKAAWDLCRAYTHIQATAGSAHTSLHSQGLSTVLGTRQIPLLHFGTSCDVSLFSDIFELRWVESAGAKPADADSWPCCNEAPQSTGSGSPG